MKVFVIALISIFVSASSFANTVVTFETNKGSFDIELNDERAPQTVTNFLQYVDSQFYAQTIFHRVIKGFVIQGGGHTVDMTKKPTNAPITNESNNGLSNVKGTIAMARTSDPHSATSQFFINTKDNTRLDYSDKGAGSTWGYAVFGKVISGMDIVEAIENSATHSLENYNDVPVEPIIVLSIQRKH